MRKRGNGEGTITKRGDGRWEARLTAPEGKRLALYGKTRQEVARKLAAAIRSRQEGVPMPPERLTVARFLADWLEHSARPAVRPLTYRGYESKIRTHILPSIGPLRLTQLAPGQVQSFLNAKRAAGLSPRSVHHLRAILRAALEDAVRWGMLARNSAALVDSPHVPSPEVEVPTPEEARRLLGVIRGHRLEALVSVALAVGLRQGEALGLRWQDVDLDRGTLTVNVTLQRINGAFVLAEPKTARSRRTLVLPLVAAAALRTHRGRQLEERMKCGAAWQGEVWKLVFTTPLGLPLQGTNVTREFQRILVRAGLPRRRFHDLRHACASLLLAQGVHPRVVMELLGHSHIGLTMNLYSHVIPELGQEAASRMEEVLAGG
jgi:integrase